MNFKKSDQTLTKQCLTDINKVRINLSTLNKPWQTETKQE